MNDQTTSDSVSGPGEITMLGLVAAIAENWKCFLIIPAVTAVAAYLLLGLLASDYRSTAILRIDQTAALLTSPQVLRATIEERGLREELGATMDDAIRKLATRISVTTIASQMTQVSLVGHGADKAQATLTTLIKHFAVQVAPRGYEREEIERQIAARSANVEQLRHYARTLTREGQNTVAAANDTNDAALGFVALVNDIQSKEDNIIALQRSLEGLKQSDILQEPTLADEAEASKRLVISLLAAVAAGLGVLFVVLVGEAFRRARHDPQASSDMKRIRNALPLSRRSIGNSPGSGGV